MNLSRLPSRRNVLQMAGVGALAAIAPAGCTSMRGGTDDEKKGYVDAHVHVWTSDTAHYPLAEGFSREKDMKPASFTPVALFAQSKSQGVKRIVLIQMSFYKFDNQYMLDSMARYPDVFSGVAIVDETKPNLRATMLKLAAQGVRGFRIYTDKEKAQAWSTSAGMKEMWTFGADEDRSMCLLANPDALPLVQAMCREYPKTRVVIDHFARIGMKGAVNDADLDNLCRLAEFPNVYVKTSAFYALGAKKTPYTDLGPMIRRLRDVYGAQRLMWASDCPFQVEEGHTYADSIALIRDRLDFLSAEDKAWMLRRTAEKVFF